MKGLLLTALLLVLPTVNWPEPRSCDAINGEWMVHTPGDQSQSQYVRRFPFSWRTHVRKCLKELS